MARTGQLVILALISGIIAPLGKAEAVPPAISPNIRSYVSDDLRNFSAQLHLVRYDPAAGRKINKDFGLIYEWMKKSRGDIAIRYKEPDQLRLDGRFGASMGSWIVNGTLQTVRLSIGLHTTANLGNTPGKRKTLLDVGLLSNDYLSYTDAQFMGVRPFHGIQCAMFKISYKNKNLDTSFRMVWIDPKTKVTLKREEYSQEGKLLSIWYYKDTVQVAPGIYMPTLIEIDDSEGALAGETAYKNIRVNLPMPDSIFK